MLGEDGRIYIDDATGAQTLVVDPEGSVQRVATSGSDVPKAGRPKPAKPAALQPGPSVPAAAAKTGAGTPPAGAAAGAAWPAGPAQGHHGAAGPHHDRRRLGAASPNGAAITAYRLSWRPVSGTAAGASQFATRS
jgi:hypothetical protein